MVVRDTFRRGMNRYIQQDEERVSDLLAWREAVSDSAPCSGVVKRQHQAGPPRVCSPAPPVRPREAAWTVRAEGTQQGSQGACQARQQAGSSEPQLLVWRLRPRSSLLTQPVRRGGTCGPWSVLGLMVFNVRISKNPPLLESGVCH